MDATSRTGKPTGGGGGVVMMLAVWYQRTKKLTECRGEHV
jgi:hypothetical protein